MEIALTSSFRSQGGMGSISENHRTRRRALDKYFNIENLVLFNPKYLGRSRVNSKAHDKRMAKASRKRMLLEAMIGVSWIMGATALITVMVFTLGLS